MTKHSIYIACILVVIGCKTPDSNVPKSTVPSNKLEELQWLVGNWTNLSEEEQSYENWSFENDSTLSGHSYTIINKDTVFEETIRVQRINNDVYFTVKVPDQNNASAVTFKMRPVKNGVFSFENLNHDFPQRIHYSQPVRDSIHAWIDGTVDGKERLVDFYFVRKQ